MFALPIHFVLAAADAARPTAPTLNKTSHAMLSGAFPVVAGGLAILVVFIVWAGFLRRSHRTPRRGRIVSTGEDSPAPSSHASSQHGGRRRKRRRESNRPRNPTLAEAGGLPPPRDPNAPPPAI